MFTLGIFYVLIYIISLAFLLVFFVVFKFSNIISTINFSIFWHSFNAYIRSGTLFKLLVLQIAGLPPVFIFFIKFSFLINVLVKSSFFVSLLILLNILLGMCFYIQFFKNISLKLTKSQFKLITLNSPILKRNSYFNSSLIYKFTFFCYFFVFFNFFSVAFYFDFYIILQNLMF